MCGVFKNFDLFFFRKQELTAEHDPLVREFNSFELPEFFYLLHQKAQILNCAIQVCKLKMYFRVLYIVLITIRAYRLDFQLILQQIVKFLRKQLLKLTTKLRQNVKLIVYGHPRHCPLLSWCSRSRQR